MQAVVACCESLKTIDVIEGVIHAIVDLVEQLRPKSSVSIRNSKYIVQFLITTVGKNTVAMSNSRISSTLCLRVLRFVNGCHLAPNESAPTQHSGSENLNGSMERGALLKGKSTERTVIKQS